MTTEVMITISGNKACRIGTPNGDVLVQPGSFAKVYIHGEQQVSVQEHGDFVSMPAPVAIPKAAVVLTDADAAADLAGTQRPDNPSAEATAAQAAHVRPQGGGGHGEE